jgi:hypothetical protein
LFPSEIGRDFYLLIVFTLSFVCAWKTGTLLWKVRIDEGIERILMVRVDVRLGDWTGRAGRSVVKLKEGATGRGKRKD